MKAWRRATADPCVQGAAEKRVRLASPHFPRREGSEGAGALERSERMCRGAFVFLARVMMLEASLAGDGGRDMEDGGTEILWEMQRRLSASASRLASPRLASPGLATPRSELRGKSEESDLDEL